MSEQEYIYIQSPLSLAAEAQLVAEILDLDVLDGQAVSPEREEVGLTGNARASDARRVVVSVGHTDPPILDGPLDLRSALDSYAFELYIRAIGFSTADGQEREARWIFDQLAKNRPDIPMLLTHEGINLVAAHLPGQAIHDFPPGTESGIEDVVTWGSWVPNAPNDLAPD